MLACVIYWIYIHIYIYTHAPEKKIFIEWTPAPVGRDAGWANGCLITLSSSLDTSSPDGTHPSVCNPESSTKLFLLRDVETGKFPTDNAQETAQKDCHTEPQGTPELMFSLHQTHQPKLGAPGGLAPSQKKNKPKTSCLLLISLLPSQPPPFPGVTSWCHSST